MAFRFRKRTRDIPVINLNLGKNGVSITIGPRGANINIEKDGAYLNTDIPETGFSNREKLFDGKITTPQLHQGEDGKQEPARGLMNSLGIKNTDLVGLKEYIEEARKDREELNSEIKQTEETYNRLQAIWIKNRTAFYPNYLRKRKR